MPTPKQKHWIGSNPFSAQNQLGMPHISYDLNNDGVVDTREYAIAKFFDKDNDGMLSESERRNALTAIENGLHKQYSFSAKGVHKLTNDELRSLNGGWIKHDGINVSDTETRSALLRKRKREMAVSANKIANDYLSNKAKNKIPIEFPYEFAQTQPIIPTKRPKTAIVCNNKTKKNLSKSRSELFEKRRTELMHGLEKSLFEAEQYFKPVAFRKLEFQQEFLRKRAKHKSLKTLKDVTNARHSENHNVGRYWEGRTNFEIFNAKKLEKEFWDSAYEKKSNEDRPLNEISHEIYSLMKNTYKSVDSLPAPFQCSHDSFKCRNDKFLGNLSKANQIAVKPNETKLKLNSSKKHKHTTFKQFSDALGDVPDNLCVLHGGRESSASEEGVASWFKQRKSCLSDTLPMFSSFSNDGIFREPVYGTSKKHTQKTNLFRNHNRLFKLYRPNTAPMNPNGNGRQRQSMLCRYESVNSFNRKRKIKFPIRTSGFF